jgi:hypothetical protein
LLLIGSILDSIPDISQESKHGQHRTGVTKTPLPNKKLQNPTTLSNGINTIKYEHEANLTYPGIQKATGWRICPELAGHPVVMQTQQELLLSSAIPGDGERAQFAQQQQQLSKTRT